MPGPPTCRDTNSAGRTAHYSPNKTILGVMLHHHTHQPRTHHFSSAKHTQIIDRPHSKHTQHTATRTITPEERIKTIPNSRSEQYYKYNYKENRVLGTRPPPVNTIEVLLPTEIKTSLAQLRFNFSKMLIYGAHR